MLRLSGLRVSVPRQLLVHICWHGEVNKTLVVVPVEVYAAIEVAGAVFNNLVGLCSESIVQVLEVVFSNVLDAKVVNGKIEPDRAVVVLPESGSVWLFEISVACKAFFEEFVGKDACLWETVHPFPNLDVDITIKHFVA